MNEPIEPQRVLPHSKPRRTSILFSLLLLFLVMLFAGVSAQAEGSKDLVKNGGYRPYIEWYFSKTYYSGKSASQTVLKRRQVINVYAKAGETLYFGSSVDAAQTKNGSKVIPPIQTKVTSWIFVSQRHSVKCETTM